MATPLFLGTYTIPEMSRTVCDVRCGAIAVLGRCGSGGGGGSVSLTDDDSPTPTNDHRRAT